MKTPLLCLFLFLAAPLVAQKRPVPPVAKYELRGVVTYFFNSNYGDKPDVGTKAYIVKAAQFAALRATPLVYAEYEYEYLNKQLAEKTNSTFADAAKFEQHDAKIAAANQKIINNPQTVVVTANGEGVFVKKLAPGKYYVLMVSAHQHHDTMSERLAAMHLEEVVIKNDDVEVSAKFDL